MLLRAAALALLVCASAPAAAQEQPAPSPAAVALPVLAADLAYGFCPMLMNGDASLNANADLIALGFPATAQAVTNARLPDFALLGQTTASGEVTVGGIPQSMCEVSVIGEQAEAALVTLRSGLSDLGLALEPDAANSGPVPQGNGIVEALKMPLPEGGVVRVQFLRASLGSGAPLASFQIMFQEQ